MSASTTAPGRIPILAPRNARVSPDGMKQMSWLSGLFATASPRAAASSRICSLGVSPTGNIARDNWSAVSTASTYD